MVRGQQRWSQALGRLESQEPRQSGGVRCVPPECRGTAKATRPRPLDRQGYGGQQPASAAPGGRLAPPAPWPSGGRHFHRPEPHGGQHGRGASLEADRLKMVENRRARWAALSAAGKHKPQPHDVRPRMLSRALKRSKGGLGLPVQFRWPPPCSGMRSLWPGVPGLYQAGGRGG